MHIFAAIVPNRLNGKRREREIKVKNRDSDAAEKERVAKATAKGKYETIFTNQMHAHRTA